MFDGAMNNDTYLLKKYWEMNNLSTAIILKKSFLLFHYFHYKHTQLCPVSL